MQHVGFATVTATTQRITPWEEGGEGVKIGLRGLYTGSFTSANNLQKITNTCERS